MESFNAGIKGFGDIFSDLLSGKKSTDEFIDDALKGRVKDRTAELLLDVQKKEVQRLLKVQNLLISELILLTNKMHQKNTDYWLDFIENNLYERND